MGASMASSSAGAVANPFSRWRGLGVGAYSSVAAKGSGGMAGAGCSCSITGGIGSAAREREVDWQRTERAVEQPPGQVVEQCGGARSGANGRPMAGGGCCGWLGNWAGNRCRGRGAGPGGRATAAWGCNGGPADRSGSLPAGVGAMLVCPPGRGRTGSVCDGNRCAMGSCGETGL